MTFHRSTLICLATAWTLLASTTAWAAKPPAPTHSSTIALGPKGKILVVTNLEANSISVITIKKGVLTKVGEVPVGIEPRSVAVDPKGKFAYVTNAVSGTVSVVPLTGKGKFTVLTDIRVGNEPRGCALTPNGARLFVANHTDGTVSVIDTKTRQVVGTVAVGGNPTAIAITDDRDKKDLTELVFVTDFFSTLIPGKDEPFDDARRGLVWAFPAGALGPVTVVTLSPLATVGFGADRGKFCNLTTDPDPHSQVYCPDTTISDPTNDIIDNDPQGAFPNQLASAVIRGGTLWIPNIGAGPEPPIKFNVNVQALVHAVNTAGTPVEDATRHVNLNAEVKLESAPANPTASLDKLFGNDLVAIDADPTASTFLIVSRGGNFVFRATVNASGKLTLGLPVKRFQTGNLPNGVVITPDGTRAYVNNELDMSVTPIDLVGNTILADISSSTPAPPGTFVHLVQLGKLVFFTGLGVPDNGLLDTPLRDIVPLENRGKASDNAWSACSSCHPDGLSDNVTWSFATGPRNTIPLDAFFSKHNPRDQRISNYSAIMGSITDFNNNSRNVQGGCGFASDEFAAACAGAATTANPNIYNHGIVEGASDALDLETLWVQTIRTYNEPKPSNTDAGRIVFEDNCAGCHGGPKWTKSQVLYADNPAYTDNPATVGVPRDSGVPDNAAGQITQYTSDGQLIVFLNDVGTFDVTNPLEIRGTGATIGQTGLGAAGFNVPSLLGIAYSAPYFHDGSAQTPDDVFDAHELGGGTIANQLSSVQRANLKTFLNSIDARTKPFRSEADDFVDAVAGP